MKKGKAEQLLTRLGKKIDQLVKKARTSDYAQKIELEKRIKELKSDRNKLEADIKNFFKEHEKDWKEIEHRGEEFIGEVKEAMENLVGKMKRK
jgi:molecular chaperone GrpE (heat shock protein)